MSTPYTDEQVRAFYAELKRQAGGKPTFSGFWWHPLEEIAGPRAFEVFTVLRERGWLRSRVIPFTYGHQEYEFLH